MIQPVFVDAFLDNDLVKRLKRVDVAAVTIASGGAMGTPGEVVVFFAGDNEIVQAKGNYVYGGLDLDALGKHLHLEKRGKKAWTEFYLGVGNTLLVNARDYDALDFNLRADPDNVETIFLREIWIILSALHGIEDELRGKIYREIFSEGEPAAKRREVRPNSRSDTDEAHLDSYGDWKIKVFIDIGRKLTPDETHRGLTEVFPDSDRIYKDALRATPEDLCIKKKIWLDSEIRVKKDNFPELIALWYPGGAGSWDWQSILDLIEGDEVSIIAWGD